MTKCFAVLGLFSELNYHDGTPEGIVKKKTDLPMKRYRGGFTAVINYILSVEL